MVHVSLLTFVLVPSTCSKPYVMSWYMYHYEHLYMYHLHVVNHMQCHGTCIIMNIYTCTIYIVHVVLYHM